ncbi:RND family efflux transporter, MFP subunit [Oceanospirillum multiglobuliferum]|uniref:Uncharacterized protein n=1 Tax=Oceanospirillum multiglobuliferum TaxID=64969 RepID=A0A1T4NMS4_9GAMM|nr:efflux RND transporter periplasmic adaptor subunit [Oceanospirillum multiglobuliferum]OPX55746.1 hypothetical protein BTE48_07605 [Oceanospirillum multiglobuliferum]SJZ80473.1 RND family efflux transporter, MFP subunit [Oceanospirillum multiglobuliferum]
MLKPNTPQWLLLATLFASSVSSAQALETLRVETKAITQNIQLNGLVEAVRQSTVAAQTAGTVSAIYYDVDDQVSPGNVLLQISDTEQQARFEQAQAGLRVAQTNLTNAEQNFNRIDSIYKKQLASQSQYDQARNQLDSAKASYRQANAALKESQKQVSYTKVIAPYGGLVTERHVEVGEVVAPGSPLMSGVDLSQLRVNVDLPQSYATTVRQNKLAEVALPSGEMLAAKGMTIFPYANSNTHNFRVRIHLPENIQGLYPGMSVKVSMPLGSQQRIMIPAQAIVVRSELRAVYVLDQQQQPQLRQVRLGQRQGQEVEILSGLQVGDQIALDPNEALNLINTARVGKDA